jgi:hypothetical protein
LKLRPLGPGKNAERSALPLQTYWSYHFPSTESLHASTGTTVVTVLTASWYRGFFRGASGFVPARGRGYDRSCGSLTQGFSDKSERCVYRFSGYQRRGGPNASSKYARILRLRPSGTSTHPRSREGAPAHPSARGVRRRRRTISPRRRRALPLSAGTPKSAKRTSRMGPARDTRATRVMRPWTGPARSDALSSSSSIQRTRWDQPGSAGVRRG